MEAIPESLSVKEVKSIGKYCCLVCQSERADKSLNGWVQCPIFKEKPICLGCCIDIQTVNRSKNFAEHPFHDIIEHIANITKQKVKEIRLICLNHQLNILNDDYPAVDKDAVFELRNHILTIIERLSKP